MSIRIIVGCGQCGKPLRLNAQDLLGLSMSLDSAPGDENQVAVFSCMQCRPAVGATRIETREQIRRKGVAQ